MATNSCHLGEVGQKLGEDYRPQWAPSYHLGFEEDVAQFETRWHHNIKSRFYFLRIHDQQ